MRLSLRAEQAELVDEDEPVAAVPEPLPDGWERLTEGSAGRWFTRTERLYVKVQAVPDRLAAECAAKDEALWWLADDTSSTYEGQLPPGWRVGPMHGGGFHATRPVPGGDDLFAFADFLSEVLPACAAVERRYRNKSRSSENQE